MSKSQRAIISVVAALFVIFAFSQMTFAQQIPPSYGFLEVVDYKNEPIADASVSLLYGNSPQKTNQNGRIENGLAIRSGSYQTPFSIEKTGFYTFVDYYDLFDFLSAGWRNNRENPIRIELLKIPGNRPEKKLIENEQQKREFFGAARSGDALAVRKFIKAGLNPNLTTSVLRGIPAKKDVPIIIFAARSGDGETVKEFLSAGVDVRTKTEPLRDILNIYLEAYPFRQNKQNYYPKTEAEKSDLLNLYENGAENLIEAGADVNSGALFTTIEKNYPRTFKKMISKGALINALDNSGRTALHLAVSYERKEIIDFLLEKGASPNTLSGNSDGYYNNYCSSPLMSAVEIDNLNLIKLLLANRADSNLTCKSGNNALRMAIAKGKDEIFETLVKAGADVKAIDESGENNLMYAVRYGNLGAVRKMIEAGIPINARNKQGSTVLIIAAESPFAERMNVIDLLLKSGADPNISNERKFNNYSNDPVQICETALIHVAENTVSQIYGDVPLKIIEMLVAHKADVDYTCENGENAVKRIIRGLRPEGLKKLLEVGANVKGEKGKAILEYARKLSEAEYYKSEDNKEKMKAIIDLLEAAGAK